ncbi:hypothetical protein Tco_0295599 [Tanacetum coccineum]
MLTHTNNVNDASINEINVVGGKTSIELPFDPNMPALEDYSIFDSSKDDEDVGVEAGMKILDTTIQVSPIPTTRIQKDHPLNQVIGKFIEVILMVDSITFGHEMVNILVSGEEYDKVFNHLDMLNSPFEGKDNTFNGMDRGDVIDHTAKVIEITKWIKMPNVEKNELRLHVLSKSLSGDEKTWWNDEINETTITCSELNDKFFHRYYPLSHTCNIKIPNDLDNETDYFEFIYWLVSKFNNYWDIDKNTKNGLWEFYVNKRTKGTIGDLNKYKEPCKENTKKTCSNTFYKPYLDAQEAKDIYEVINREYSPIPIPAHHDIDNPRCAELKNSQSYDIQ